MSKLSWRSAPDVATGFVFVKRSRLLAVLPSLPSSRLILIPSPLPLSPRCRRGSLILPGDLQLESKGVVKPPPPKSARPSDMEAWNQLGDLGSGLGTICLCP